MQKWIYFTSILTFLNIIGYIIIKSLSSENDIAVACYMSLFIGLIALLISLYLFIYNKSILILKKNTSLLPVLIMSIMFFVSFVLLFNAVSFANNPGYVRAFVSIEITILFIIFTLIDGKMPHYMQIIGVILAATGIALITIYENNSKLK